MRRIGLGTFVAGALVAAGLPVASAASAPAVTGVSCTPTPSVVAPAAASGGFHSFGPVRLADTRSQLVNVGAGCALDVEVPTVIPDTATSVVLSVTADRTAAAGFLTAFPCGSSRPDVSNVNVRPGTPTANVVIAPLDTTRQICVYTSVATDLIVDITGYLGPNGAAFQESAPRRAVDTRFPDQRPDGGSGPVGPGVLTIPRSSLGVAADVTAVIVNVTATQASGSGYLTAFPCAAAVPDTSNVNFARNEDRASQAIVGLAADGSLCVFASVATHVIVDVSGVFAGSEGLPFASSVGARLVDSRNGVGGWSTPIAAGETRVVDPRGLFLADARSVVVNVLATRSVAAGFLTVFPCGSTPSTSSVNFGPGRDVANLVVSSVDLVDGRFCVFASAPTDVVIDVFGAFTARGLSSLTFGPGTPIVAPAFQSNIHDYAARCAAGSNSFAVDAFGTPGTTVAIDGVGQTQHATRTVAKTEDAAVVVTVTGSFNASDSYWIRCLPHDFPPLTVDRPGQPAPGWYLVANAFNPTSDTYAEFAMILDEHGTPVWYRRTPPGAIDFKRLSTGQLAWIIPTGGAFGLDNSGSYEVRDLDGTLEHNVKTTLGPTDHHDLVLLPNGNYLAITYVQRALAPGDSTSCLDGNTLAVQTPTAVVDGVIEEIDPAGVTTWSWDSHAHINPSESVVNLCFPGAGGAGHLLDPAHLNSIDVMPNGDIIASARHLDAIFRIDRTTGQVVWKLGGTLTTRDAGAQILAFRNDSYNGFARQHDARVMPNGDVSLFDNRTPFPSAVVTGAARATEYKIDTTAATATLVRSQARPDGFPSGAMGSTQWLGDGGVVVGWGAFPGTAFTEFAADGTPLYSVGFPPGHFTYRAVKEPKDSFSVDALRATAGH